MPWPAPDDRRLPLQADPDLDGLAGFENGLLFLLAALHLEADRPRRAQQGFDLGDLERVGRAIEDHGYRLRPNVDQQDPALSLVASHGSRVGAGILGWLCLGGLGSELFRVIVQ